MEDYAETMAVIPLKLRELLDAFNNKDMSKAFEIADDIQNDCFGLKLLIIANKGVI